MMKGYIAVFLAVALLTAALSGCAAAAGASPAAIGGAGTSTRGAQGGAGLSASARSGGYAGTEGSNVAAQGKRSVIGRVQGIVGNEVTLLLAVEDAPAMGADGEAVPSALAAAPSEAAATAGVPSKAAAEAPSAEGDAGEGTAPAKGDAASGTGASGRTGARRGAGYTFGEETAVYLLPVGMKIGSGTFSAVKAGNVLRLSFNERADGTEYIVSVQLLS